MTWQKKAFFLTIPHLPNFHGLIYEEPGKNACAYVSCGKLFTITFNRSNYKRANAPIYHTHSLILTKYFVINFPIKCQLNVRVHGSDPFFIALVYIIHILTQWHNKWVEAADSPNKSDLNVTEVSRIRTHIFHYHNIRIVVYIVCVCVFAYTLIRVDCDSGTVATITR